MKDEKLKQPREGGDDALSNPDQTGTSENTQQTGYGNEERIA